ncbi:MAG: histidine phosphatase family protein [Lachnospiraceae bacterium]|nr:histidine phosphatase family protein [Lachnospiraceae bacterium]
MIYIMRHGQTVKNKSNLLQGRADDPLNETGIQQASDAGRWFAEQGIHFDRIYSSPLQRAVDSARLAAGGDPEIIINDRLIEMEYGPYEGMDMRSAPPELLFFFKDFVNNPAPAGMEQLSDVVRRLGAFLEQIRNDIIGKNVLISTHAIAMKGALEYLTPESKGSYWTRYIGNCAVYAAELSDDGIFSVPYEVYTMDTAGPGSRES